MVNSLKFNSVNYRILKNLSMMAYITEIQNSLIFNFMNMIILGNVTKLNTVYIFIRRVLASNHKNTFVSLFRFICMSMHAVRVDE